MKAISISLTTFLITALVGFMLANTAIPAASSGAMQSSNQSAIAVQLSALQQLDGVRYSVTIINPADQALPGLSVVVALPSGAALVQALATDGYTRFLGALNSSQGLDLSWSGNFNAGDYVDAFAFTLQEPVVSNIGVNLKWSGDQPGQVIFWGQPTVLAAGSPESELTLGAAGTGDALLPVGATGVQVGVAQGQLPDNTKIHVRLMDPGENPPDTDNLWWCSAVEVSGLPTGAELTVLVPLRQPLPPGVPVALFSRQADGKWGQLAAQGIVTFDGQHVAYTHRGGEVATGIQTPFQPKPKLPLTVLQPTATIAHIVSTPVILRATPTAIPVQPTRTPAPLVVRATRIVPTLALVAQQPATKVPVKVTSVPVVLTASVRTTRLPASPLPPPVTATAANKSVVHTPTSTPGVSCKAAPGVLCFGSGTVSLVSFCSQSGVNCISTGTGGTTCVSVAGGPQQCTAAGSTVTLLPGGGVRFSGLVPTATTATFKRSATPTLDRSRLEITLAPTSNVIIVTATYVPQPTICVQSTAGVIDCTNQNGQLGAPPTVTPRGDGGECWTITENGLFGSVDLTICVDANGLECTQPLPVPYDAPFTCLSPYEPGYITPP